MVLTRVLLPPVEPPLAGGAGEELGAHADNIRAAPARSQLVLHIAVFTIACAIMGRGRELVPSPLEGEG